MEKIWIFVLKLFKRIFGNWKNVVMCLLCLVSFVLYLKYDYTRDELSNVIIQKNDSIVSYKNKVDEMYSQIGTYITDIDHLKESNTELYNEVKNLKDNPIIVTKTNTVTQLKEIHVIDTAFVIGEGIYKSHISYNDKWTSIEGSNIMNINNMISEVTFDSISFINNFTLDLIENRKGSLSFIVKSDNPYCQINNINGVMLSPEDSKAIKKRYKDKWCLAVGVGPSVGVIDGNIKVIPALQLTFGIKILGF